MLTADATIKFLDIILYHTQVISTVHDYLPHTKVLSTFTEPELVGSYVCIGYMRQLRAGEVK